LHYGLSIYAILPILWCGELLLPNPSNFITSVTQWASTTRRSVGFSWKERAMNRFCFLLLFAMAIAMTVAISSRADDTVALDAQTMKVALHTSTPEENGFIQKVLDQVALGTLPESLVKSTFLWAKKKPQHKFQYFKHGLIRRAVDAGITIF
jgi:hypothetical protein